MLQNKRMRLIVPVIAALLVLVMIGSTFAYWAQELTVKNEFQLARYSTDLVEAFEAPSDWLPGIEINKDVSVNNEGSIPVFTRIRITQQWLRGGDPIPLKFMGEAAEEYAALIKWGTDVVLLSSGKTADSSLSQGLPAVKTVKEAEGKWLLINETPDQNNSFTLYYIGTIAPGGKSPLIVDSVVFNKNVRSKILLDQTVWDKSKAEWVTSYVENQTNTYNDARFTLGVTMTTVQATAAAMKAIFDSDNLSEQALISELEQFGFEAAELSGSYDNTVKEHRLYFAEADGKMKFTPIRGSDEPWFMSRLNMVPGGDYTHELTIENGSKETHELYMMVVPLAQDEKLDQLLDYIKMQVYQDSELIYSGTAAGKAISGSPSKAVALGKHAPDDVSRIKVDLQLDKDVSLDYAGLLTKIDWKFMVNKGQYLEEPDPEPKTEPETKPDPGTEPGPGTEPRPGDNPRPYPSPRTASSVKTGDQTNYIWYILIMTLSGCGLLSCIVYIRKSRKEQ